MPFPFEVSVTDQRLKQVWAGYDTRLRAPTAAERDANGRRAEELEAAVATLEAHEAELSAEDRAELVGARAALAYLHEPVRRVGPEVDGASARRGAFGARGGFQNEDALYAAIARAGIQGHVDPRLVQNTAGDLQQEGVGGDGGYMLPSDKRAFQALLTPPESLIGRTEILITPSNSVTLPFDDDPVWSSSMAAADVAEGGTLTETKAAVKTATLTLAKQGVLVRVTGEMLEDGTNVGPFVLRRTTEKLQWGLDAKFWAAAVASGAKKTITYTAGTTRDGTSKYPLVGGIQKMWGGMLPQHRSQAVWLINPQIEPTLQGFSVGNQPVYVSAGLPFPGTASISSGSILYGRPAIFSELCGAPGTVNDIMLVCPSAFYCVLKSNSPRTDVSIHAEFAKDVVGYRSYLRSAVASKFAGLITRGDSSTAGNAIVMAIA